jgi:hypothetical protein
MDKLRIRNAAFSLFSLVVLLISDKTIAASVNGSKLPQGEPVITWASDPVWPDDTVVLSGGDFDPNCSVEINCLQQPEKPGTPENVSGHEELKSWQEIKPVQTSDNSVKFILPADFKMGAFYCRLAGRNGRSKAVLINAADIWWMQGDLGKSASPGGCLRVFGKSLNFGRGSLAYLVSAAGKSFTLKASTADCYNLVFRIPADIPDANYTVFVHNGSGDVHAWKKAGIFEIKTPQAWPSQVFNVKQAGLEAALAKAKENNGGIIYFPRGQYEMKGQILLPPHTIIKGQGNGLATIYWSTMTEPPASLITGKSFGIEDISIYVEGFHHNVIEDLPDSDGIRISNVRIRANAFFRLMDMGDLEKEWRGKKNLHSTRENGSALHLQGRNFQVTGCDILATNKGIELSNARDGLIAGNKIRYGINGVSIECIDGMIVENNQIIGGHLAATGNAFSSYFNPSSQNIYFSGNTLRNAYGYDTEAFTFDGAGGAYLGKLAEINCTRMVLAQDPKPRTYQPTYTNWTGAAFCIVQGRGLGQYRRVTHNNGRTWDIDRSWDISPDANSVISIVPFRGRVLFLKNTLEDEGIVQAYGTSIDCVFALNQLIRADGFGSIGRNPHGWGWQPSWFCQYLDNHIVEGNRWGPYNGHICLETLNVEEDDVESGGSGKNIEFWGPLTRCCACRRNVLENNADMEITGTVNDSVIEKCTIRNSDKGITVAKTPQNILLRKNTFENVDKPAIGESLTELRSKQKIFLEY